MSHGSDLVHLWTDESYPESVVANGGIYAWPDDRQNPDTVVAAVTWLKDIALLRKAETPWTVQIRLDLCLHCGRLQSGADAPLDSKCSLVGAQCLRRP